MQMRVSVVIPAYNAEIFLAETLESVFEQTYRDLEIILIDDGSTDDTSAVARSILERSPFPHKILCQHNSGVASARNLGWKSASGQWIQFLDADDLLRRDKIDLQLAEVRREMHADVIYSDWQRLVRIDGAWRRVDLRTPMIGPQALADILADRNFLQIGSLLYRRSILEKVNGFDTDHEPIEDVGCCVKIAMEGGRFLKADSAGPVAFYRDLPRSLSKIDQRRFIDSCIRNAKLAEHYIRRNPGAAEGVVEAVVRVYYLGARFFAGSDWRRFEQIVADIEALQPGFVPKSPRRLALLSRVLGYKHAEWLAVLIRKVKGADRSRRARTSAQI
jgi:glycosyltransferase involved in cell wall biosynthesis